MGKIKILAVSSLPAHRNAGLKAQLSVLKNDILPVPTVILSGVTSFSKVYKQTIDLQPLLEATMELCLEQNQSFVL